MNIESIKKIDFNCDYERINLRRQNKKRSVTIRFANNDPFDNDITLKNIELHDTYQDTERCTH